MNNKRILIIAVSLVLMLALVGATFASSGGWGYRNSKDIGNGTLVGVVPFPSGTSMVFTHRQGFEISFLDVNVIDKDSSTLYHDMRIIPAAPNKIEVVACGTYAHVLVEAGTMVAMYTYDLAESVGGCQTRFLYLPSVEASAESLPNP